MHRDTVVERRRRFRQRGRDAALYDQPRPGARPKVTGDLEAQLTRLAGRPPAQGEARWTLPLLADKMVALGDRASLRSRCIGRRAVKKNELKPWRVKAWGIAQPAAQCVAKREDGGEVSPRPYHPPRRVGCLEAASKEWHETPHGSWPLPPGQQAQEDYQYARPGVCNRFLKVAPRRGGRGVSGTERGPAGDFAEQLRGLGEADDPEADKVGWVTAHLNPPTPACRYERLAPERAPEIAAKIEWHYTPEQGAWLNRAECALSRCIGMHREVGVPMHRDPWRGEAAGWAEKRNGRQVTIDWQFTTKDARIKLKRLYPIIKEQNST